MAKYAYAPLSVDESKRKADSEDTVNERMPMCVGVCVLVAIVYVLSRTGAVVENVSSPIPSPVAEPRTVSSSSSSSTYLNLRADTSSVSKPTSKPVSTSLSTSTSKSDCNCDGLIDPKNFDIGEYRKKALANIPPGIIECAEAKAGESQSACHLSKETRFSALKQKGATLWMTGCSGSGKTTIATALEDRLVKEFGKHVYRLDGDNLRTGLNRDLTFTEADRAESVRRTGELSVLFADSGIITLVGLISPYREDRDLVRKRHEDMGIPFYEVFLDVPIDELKKRDPKGQYARVEAGELKHFTCIDDPYEEPLHAEITLPTHELTPDESADILFKKLVSDGVLEGAPLLSKAGLPNPDGDEIIDLHVPESKRAAKTKEAEHLPKVLMNNMDVNWLQVVAEGWASPLKGFMREGTLLETLHFNSILVDPFNLTGNVDHQSAMTDFQNFPNRPPPTRVSMSVPITLAISDFQKKAIEESGKTSVALTTFMGKTLAIMHDVEIYANRKEEIISRLFGAMDEGHPYIKQILKQGDYLIGGEVEVLDRIRYNDGLDQWRKTATELMDEFQEKGADTVYAFQTRNPTHAGHAYLMRAAGERLKDQGFKKPVLWLSPLGGWTKSDDVPLDVRIHQHEEVLKAGLTHPGGLDPDATVMAIWPSPMLYAGPTEVQFHAKSRRSAGASYFVVGRDPAGIPRSDDGEDMYHGDHGRYVLQNAPGIAGNMELLSFVKVMYDISDNIMKEPDSNRPDDFISISGTKMRLLARNGASPCSATDIPTDLVEANCIPSGFMVPNGWKHVVDYYKHIDEKDKWTPWSEPLVPAPKADNTKDEGTFGTVSYRLYHNEYPSLWHDVPLTPKSNSEDNVINFITEIPMYYSSKMELSKEEPNNPIMQDTNKDGSPRYYSYGVSFFNYGLIPQTWEDPELLTDGIGGDNDPLDVMEVGSHPFKIGSITPCRVIGSLLLIDEGETDYKILCISTSDPDAKHIHSTEDLEKIKPGYLDNLRLWLKRYKTTDGKPENNLAQDEPYDLTKTLDIIKETHDRWNMLCGNSRRRLNYSLYGGDAETGDEEKKEDMYVSKYRFSLASKNCRG